MRRPIRRSPHLRPCRSRVHRSGRSIPPRCTSGTDVVVKVRRPNVVEDMEQDFEIMQNFAGDQWVQIRACFRTSQHPESSRLNALAA
jgi:hypothetical protein